MRPTTCKTSMVLPQRCGLGQPPLDTLAISASSLDVSHPASVFLFFMVNFLEKGDETIISCSKSSMSQDRQRSTVRCQSKDGSSW